MKLLSHKFKVVVQERCVLKIKSTFSTLKITCRYFKNITEYLHVSNMPV